MQTAINPRTLPAPNASRFNTTQSGRQALALLDAHRGRFATVTFIKRTTGESRTMQVIFSRRYLIGQWRFSPAQKGLLPVWDVQAAQIKLIPLEGIRRITAGGRSYSAKPQAVPAQPEPMRCDVDGTPFEDASRRVSAGVPFGPAVEKARTSAPPAAPRPAPSANPQRNPLTYLRLNGLSAAQQQRALASLF